MKKEIIGIAVLAGLATLPLLAQSQKNKTAKDAPTHATKKGNPTDNQVPVLVLTHPSLATASGCWATLFDDDNYYGRSITLYGEQNLADVDLDMKPYVIGGDPDSVIVGPKATLALYGDEDYEDLDHTFAADSKVPDLDKEPFWQKIESVRLNCTK